MDWQAAWQELRNFGRGFTGALLLGTPFLMTMETWWAAWVLPLPYVALYTLVGLAILLVVDVVVGFREQEEGKMPSLWHIVTGFATLIFQSFLAAYIVLLTFGALELSDPPLELMRMGLVQLVPLGLGAAIANRLLHDSGAGGKPSRLVQEMGAFLLGSLLFIFPIAPTEEVRLIATRADWWRLLILVLVTLAASYVTLFLLEFRGQKGRLHRHPPWLRLGDVCTAFALAMVLSFAILAAFGHFEGAPPQVWVQLTIVLAFPATLGGSAARVIL